MVGCTFWHALLQDDQHAIDQSGCVHATAMHDCIQQKVKSLFSMQNPLIYAVFTTKRSLTFKYQGGCGTL